MKLGRSRYLVLGVLGMLLIGVIYAWSILKAPLAHEFGWSPSDLALNYTLTMCFFCLGGTIGSLLSKWIGPKVTIVSSAVLACSGFLLVSRLSGHSLSGLYLSYGMMAGLGIGIAYNTILSVVGAWFPDIKGISSGCLMMGFGSSSLVIGSLAGTLFNVPQVGWRMTFSILAMLLGAVLLVVGFGIRQPNTDELEEIHSRCKKDDAKSASEKDYTPIQMVTMFSFWRFFLCVTFLSAVGSTVISFAKDLALSVGIEAVTATAFVGVLSICNGLGRILTGFLFDRMGRRKVMILANFVTISAAAATLVSVLLASGPLCMIALCMVGISYGACPTIAAALISDFYGMKYYSFNLSIINFNLMCAAWIASVANNIFAAAGSFVMPFWLLLALSIAAMFLNISIREP